MIEAHPLKRLWWLRHGPTHERAFCGWRDVPADLSDTAAIARLSAFLPQAPIVASDLLRARQTAEAVAQHRPRLPDMKGLREFHFGVWDGKRHDEAMASHPDLARAFWETPGDISAPEGESWNSAASRVTEAVSQILPLASPDLIVVAHFGVILTRLQLALQQTPDQVIAQPIDNLSLTCLAYDGQHWHAELINHIP